MGKKIIALATAVMAVSALGKTTTNMVVAAVLLFCNFSVIAEAQLHDGGARNIHYAADANTPPGIGLPELQNIATILTSDGPGIPDIGEPDADNCNLNQRGFLVKVVKAPAGTDLRGDYDLAYEMAEWLVDSENLGPNIPAIELGSRVVDVVNLYDSGGHHNFTGGEETFPGIDAFAVDPCDPADGDDDNDFAILVTGCIELTKGLHILGGACDSGIKIEIGGAEIGRTSAWNETSAWIIEAPKTGLYSFRAIGFEQDGAAHMEIHEFLPDGSLILLNHPVWGRSPVYVPEFASTACPSADLTGDCFVDFNDFALMAAEWPTTDFNGVAVMANQWLTIDPCLPDDMAYIRDGEFQMGDNFNEGDSHELPVHTVTVDSFYMGKYEITNQQYCDYLNDANSLGEIKVVSGTVYASFDTSIIYPYCDTSTADDDSQIAYSAGVFSVRTKSGRDMSDDPMVMVSWYGAIAYCNWRNGEEGYEACYNLYTWDGTFSKHGYRLPTEAEWEYAARGGLSARRFPWGDTISHSQANYYSMWDEGSPRYPYDVSPTEGSHPTWNDGVRPYTSVVGSFAANAYGLYDITGNVWEWCNDKYASDYYDYSPTSNPIGPVSDYLRVFRGGGWSSLANYCRVALRVNHNTSTCYNNIGFRVALDLN